MGISAQDVIGLFVLKFTDPGGWSCSTFVCALRSEEKANLVHYEFEFSRRRNTFEFWRVASLNKNALTITVDETKC